MYKAFSGWALILAMLTFPAILSQNHLFAQTNHPELLDLLQDKNTRTRIGAINALSTAVIRGISTSNQSAATIKALKQLCNDPDPVIRSAVSIELLKVADAAENDELSQFAIWASKDKNINVRRRVMSFFRSYFSSRFDKGKIHQKLLQQKLSDSDFETRFHAAATLHSWGVSNDDILKIMLDSLELNNYRAATLYSLIHHEKNRDRLLNLLLERLRSSKQNTAVHVNVVAMLTPESKKFTGELLKFFDDDRETVRAAVVDAIGRLKSNLPQSLQLLDKAANDKSTVIRRLVLPSLVRLQTDKKILQKYLLKLMVDRDQSVCLAAAEAVAWFETDYESIRPGFENVLLSTESNQVIAALKACISCGPMTAKSGPVVASLMKSPNPEIQMRACWALGEMEVERHLFLDAATDALNSKLNENVLQAILDSLSRFATENDDFQNVFAKYLNHENPSIRLACVQGLKIYAPLDMIDKVLPVPIAKSQRNTDRVTNIDTAIVDVLVAMGEEGSKALISYLEHDNPRVRGRALLAITHFPSQSNAIQAQLLSSLDSADPFEAFCAAKGLVRAGELDANTLERIFNVSNPNDRQQTIRILNLLATLGSKAGPIAPRIGYLMNGGYRNRFSTDAMRTLISLGEHAAPAIQALLTEPVDIEKIECLAAIGPAAALAEPRLRAIVTDMESKIATAKSMRQRAFFRRTRVAAAIALWHVSGDSAPANRVMNQEIGSESSAMALTAFPSFAAADQQLITQVVNMLPKISAINALGNLGPPAKAAIGPLQKIAANGNETQSYEARKAIWKITNNAEVAIMVVHEIFQRNQFNLVEIRVEDRQRIRETLSFLNATENATAKKLLDQVQAGRFPNLRAYVRQLRSAGN